MGKFWYTATTSYYYDFLSLVLLVLLVLVLVLLVLVLLVLVLLKLVLLKLVLLVLLLLLSPSVSCSCIDALNARSTKLLLSPSVSECLQPV